MFGEFVSGKLSPYEVKTGANYMLRGSFHSRFKPLIELLFPCGLKQVMLVGGRVTS